MTDWLKTVHAYMLESGAGMTSAEVTAKFGDPLTGALSTKQLQYAREKGLFVVKRTGDGNKHRYFAMATNNVRRGVTPSYFDGESRFRSAPSVFHLVGHE